jgi:hypothetical protein
VALVKADGNAGLLLDFLGHRGGGRWSMSSMEVRTSNSNLRKYLSPLGCRWMPEVGKNLAAATGFGSGLWTPPPQVALLSIAGDDPSYHLLISAHLMLAV